MLSVCIYRALYSSITVLTAEYFIVVTNVQYCIIILYYIIIIISINIINTECCDIADVYMRPIVIRTPHLQSRLCIEILRCVHTCQTRTTYSRCADLI